MSEAAAAELIELGLRTSEAAALGLTERDCAFAIWPVLRSQRRRCGALISPFEALERVKTLIEIHHQGHVFPDCIAHSFDGCDIISDPLAAQSQLQSCEPSLVS